ncbi:MAG: hypothetical protein ACK5HL_01620 [Bacilli bacterium]
MNGYERLKELYKKNQHKDEPLIKIMKYLLQQQEMEKLYRNEEKSLTQMMELINEKAREFAVNSVSVIDDPVIYEWATDYFKSSNEKLGLNRKKLKHPKSQLRKKN